MVTICKQTFRAPIAPLPALTASKKRGKIFAMRTLFTIFAEDRRHLGHLSKLMPLDLHYLCRR